jgi:hypothetical protein
MKLYAKPLILAVALSLGICAAIAQTPAPKANTSPNAKTYRLTFTITETDSGKRIGTQHVAMIVITGGRTTLKQGSKIPVVTGSFSSNGTPGQQTQFTYLDVGLNIDASLDELGDTTHLRAKIEQSSFADSTDLAGVREPIIRQTVMEGTSVMILGKPIMLGSIDIPASTRHLDIEVVMESVH